MFTGKVVKAASKSKKRPQLTQFKENFIKVIHRIVFSFFSKSHVACILKTVLMGCIADSPEKGAMDTLSSMAGKAVRSFANEVT